MSLLLNKLLDKKAPRFTLRPEAVIAAAIVIIVALGLWFLARPSGSSARIAQLETQLKSVERSLASGGDLMAYPLGSVCSGDVASLLKDQMNIALMNTGLKVTTLNLSDAYRAGGAHPLTGYRYIIKANGSYEAAVMGLKTLDSYRPKLFLDTLSIKNRISDVDIAIEGRVFCR